MTHWTVETMIYRQRYLRRRRKVVVGNRISADGGKSWIDEGEVHGTWDDTFSNVTRELNTKEYKERIANPRKITLLLSVGRIPQLDSIAKGD